MTNSTITQLINDLASKTAANSITPSTVANILTKLLAAIPDASSSSGSSSSATNFDYFFGAFDQLITSPTVEQELIIGTAQSQKINTYFTTNMKDGEGPVVTALRNCLVEVTGFVTLRATDSYTADRVLRWYKLDEEGERYAGSTITVHFTGTTQIFTVPIAHSTFLKAGETLHLVHYSSSGASSISANSSIYIKATPTT